MNHLESLVYRAVRDNPRIKNLVRDAYQAVFSLAPVPGKKTMFPVTSREGYFFGFHDKIPWSADSRFLLAHGYNSLPNRMPSPADRVDIGVFGGEGFTEFRKLASSGCFNWQQGSMLQWIGGGPEFVFNDHEGNQVVARIFSADGRQQNMLPLPVAATEPGGRFALSYSFPRLQKHFPGYGYMHGNDPEIEVEKPGSHGISLLDMQSGSAVLLFSVADIAAVLPDKTMNGAFHFLTHCLFSPSGKRFLFLHRWVKDANATFTRMFSCDRNGSDLHLFPTGGMVSHIAWRDEQQVLAYSRTTAGRDGYILFTDRSSEYLHVAAGILNSDGHPSFPKGIPAHFITDTYPDRFRRSYLILFDMAGGKRTDLGYFRQPLSYKEEIRCDLHPRWNHDGTMICFDSAHAGRRALCTMPVLQDRPAQEPTSKAL